MNELELIATAKKGGNKGSTALNTLWTMHEDFMRTTHDFGPLGMKHGRSARSPLARPYEDFLYEIFMTFRNAVRLFDPAAGVSFRTFLANKMRWDAKSVIRGSRKKVTLETGEQVDVTIVDYDVLQSALQRSKHSSRPMDEEDYATSDCDSGFDSDSFDEIEEQAKIDDAVSSLPNDCDSLSGSYTMGKGNPARDKAHRILNLFPAGSRKRSVLDTYLRLAAHNSESPTVREIGDELGCSGANVSTLMKGIRSTLEENGITWLSAA